MESPNSPAILLMSTGHANRQAVNTENTFKRQRYASDGPSTEVVRFLCEIGLHRFAGCMHDQLGIDVLSDLQYLTENMLESIGMLPTQVAKMLAVARWTHRTFKSTGCASVSQSGKENNSEALGRHRRSKEWVFADQWSGSSQNLDGKIACELAQPVQFSEKIQRKGKSIIDSIVVKLMVCDAVGSTMAFNVARVGPLSTVCQSDEVGGKYFLVEDFMLCNNNFELILYKSSNIFRTHIVFLFWFEYR